ncbi:MAG TPA: DUF502 domain-containing protein [Bacteroidia bacterium]|nr:DUF502 domain-containing protein [Bacteroidia bacterium]
MKRLLRYFIQGLVITIPLGITVLIFAKIFFWIQGWFSDMQVIVHEMVDPFIVILIVLAFIFLVGIFASNVVARLLLNESGKLIEKIPVIRHIYSPVKDFTGAFIGNKKRFNNPVLVTTNKEADIREVGFITDHDLHEIGLGPEYVAVYMPMSYSISGRLLIVPKSNVSAMDANPADVMKFVVSGGVSEVDEH